MKVYIVQLLYFGKSYGNSVPCATLEDAKNYVSGKNRRVGEWIKTGHWWYADGDEACTWTIREAEVLQ
jgi:hypothetical protein